MIELRIAKVWTSSAFYYETSTAYEFNSQYKIMYNNYTTFNFAFFFVPYSFFLKMVIMKLAFSKITRK